MKNIDKDVFNKWNTREYHGTYAWMMVMRGTQNEVFRIINHRISYPILHKVIGVQ